MRIGCRLKAVGRRTHGIVDRQAFGDFTYSLQSTAYGLCRDRRGISLTEVLISMFVLMIGLLGVAAMIPAGRHEILEGRQVDSATAVGRAAFRDLKIRRVLNPADWRDSAGASIYSSPNAAHLTYWFPKTRQTYVKTPP